MADEANAVIEAYKAHVEEQAEESVMTLGVKACLRRHQRSA